MPGTSRAVRRRFGYADSAHRKQGDARKRLQDRPGSEFEVVAPDRKELDITVWDRVVERLNHISPQVVVNCAAFTDVDACEDHPLAVRKANVEGPRNLAQASARFNCKMIHISTDYVFSGQKSIPQPYFEDDAMEPISAYGRSKMESEMAVRTMPSTM